MKKNIYFGIILFLFSCSNESKKRNIEIKPDNKIAVTDTAYVDGVLLELIDNNGTGELKIHSNQYKISGKLLARTPYYFLRRDGKVLSFSYPEINVDHTIIIKGGGAMQGVIFKKDSIIYEDYVSSEPFDVKNGVDEKVYFDFAYRRHNK